MAWPTVDGTARRHGSRVRPALYVTKPPAGTAAYLGVSNKLALLRLLPMSDRACGSPRSTGRTIVPRYHGKQFKKEEESAAKVAHALFVPQWKLNA